VARGYVTLIARSVGGSNQCFGGSLIHPPTAGSGYLKESELENQTGSRYLEKKNRIVKLPGMSTFKTLKEFPGFKKESPVLYRFFSFLIFLLSRSWDRVVQSTGRVLICPG